MTGEPLPPARMPGVIASAVHGELIDCVDAILSGSADEVSAEFAALAAREDLLDLWVLLDGEAPLLLARLAWTARGLPAPSVGRGADEHAARLQDRARQHEAQGGAAHAFTEHPSQEDTPSATGLGCAVALLAAIRRPVVHEHRREGPDEFAQRSLLMQLAEQLDRERDNVHRVLKSPFLGSSWLFTSPEDRAAVVARVAWAARRRPLGDGADACAIEAHQAARDATERPTVKPLPHEDRAEHLRAALHLMAAIPPEERSALWTLTTNS